MINDKIGNVGINDILFSVNNLQHACHNAAKNSGWWTDLKTGESLTISQGETPKFNVSEKLMLMVSELGEAMEGYRKNLMDQHLPNRSNFEVELADTVIRIFDTAGGMGLDLAGAIVEKMQYNANRADHKLANRKLDNGKKF